MRKPLVQATVSDKDAQTNIRRERHTMRHRRVTGTP